MQDILFPYLFRFVWRQLEFAFFGATTSVVALFDFALKEARKENIMDTVERYRKKVLKLKLLGGVILILGIVLFAIEIHFAISGYEFDSPLPVFACYFGGLFCFVLGIAVLINPKVVWRKYNGDYIIYYNGISKGYLIINDEIQSIGGAFQYHFYGQLPDGTEVYVKVTALGSAKISIGKYTNNMISFM